MGALTQKGRSSSCWTSRLQGERRFSPVTQLPHRSRGLGCAHAPLQAPKEHRGITQDLRDRPPCWTWSWRARAWPINTRGGSFARELHSPVNATGISNPASRPRLGGALTHRRHQGQVIPWHLVPAPRQTREGTVWHWRHSSVLITRILTLPHHRTLGVSRFVRRKYFRKSNNCLIECTFFKKTTGGEGFLSIIMKLLLVWLI